MPLTLINAQISFLTARHLKLPAAQSFFWKFLAVGGAESGTARTVKYITEEVWPLFRHKQIRHRGTWRYSTCGLGY